MNRIICFRKYVVFLLIIVCLILTITFPCIAQEAVDMRAVIQKYAEYFLSFSREWVKQGNYDAAQLSDSLSNLAKAKHSFSPEDWFTMLRTITRIGKKEQSPYSCTGYVEDRKTVEVLVFALKEDNREIREFALKTLTWQVRQVDLQYFAKAIVNGLSKELKDEELLLFAKLGINIDKDRKNKIISRGDAPLEVKARLGDEESEQILINNFINEEDFYKKQHFSRLLGYVASEKCAIALINALDSSVQIKSLYEDLSIRGPVLIALGNIYQDELLLTRDALFLVTNGEEALAKLRGNADFVKDVKDWVRKKFGKSIWKNQDIWFIRKYVIPIINQPEKAR